MAIRIRKGKIVKQPCILVKFFELKFGLNLDCGVDRDKIRSIGPPC